MSNPNRPTTLDNYSVGLGIPHIDTSEPWKQEPHILLNACRVQEQALRPVPTRRCPGPRSP